MFTGPNNLSEYFENFCQSNIFKTEYDQIKQNLQQLKNQIQEQTIVISGLKQNKKRIKNVKQNSEEYKQLLQQVENIEYQVRILQFLEIDVEIQNQSENIEKKISEKNDISFNLNSFKQKHNQSFQKFQEQQTELQNNLKEQKEIDIDINQTKKYLKDLDENIRMLNQQLDSKNITKNSFLEQIAQKQNAAQGYMKKMEECQQKINEIDQILKDDVKRVEFSPQERQQYLQLKQQLFVQCYGTNQEISVKKTQRQKHQNEIDQLEKKLQDLSEIQNKFIMNKMQINEKISQNEIISQTLQVEFENSNRKYQQQQVWENAILQQIQQLENNLQDQEIQKSSFIAKQNAVNDQGIDYQLHKYLKRKIPGYHGQVCDIISSINKKYDQAVNNSLGSSSKYLVVTTKDDANELGSILTEKGIMRDVLVLENMKDVDQHLMHKLRSSLDDLGHLVMDVVTFDNSIRYLDKCAYYLLKGKVFCDSVEKIQLLREKNIQQISQYISIDDMKIIGNSIELIITNQKPVVFSKIDQQKFQIEKDLNASNQQISELKNKIRSLKEQHTIEDKPAQIKIKQAEILSLQMVNQKKNESFKNELIFIQRQISQIQIQIQEHQYNIQLKESEKSLLDSAILELQEKIFEQKKKKFENFCKMNNLDLNSIAHFDNEGQSEGLWQKQRAQEILRKSQELYEQNNHIIGEHNALKTLDSEIFKQNEYLQKTIQKQEQLLKDLQNLEEKHQVVQQKHGELKSNLNQLQVSEEKFQHKILDFVSQIRELDDQIQDHKLQIQQIMNKKFQLYELSSIQGIKIQIGKEPSQFLSQMQSQIQRGILKLDLDSHNDNISLNLKKNNLNQIKEKKQNYELELVLKNKKLDEYSSNIQNQSLIDQEEQKLKQVDEKIIETSKFLDALVQKERQLILQFNQIKNKRSDVQFWILLNIFTKYKGVYKIQKTVSEIIDNTYKELTRDNQHPELTGKAQLYLENKDEPFNGGIIYSPTPPSKRFVYDIDQLSGGEKTIAGLSLLLAMNLIIKSPFIIFDESDAFLDQNNSQKLLQLSKNSQFKQLQFILITHKKEIFEKSQSLVGVTYDDQIESTAVFSLDLR